MGFLRYVWELILGESEEDRKQHKGKQTLGQFCTDEEAQRARNEINRLVDEFIVRQTGRPRPHNLEEDVRVNLGHAPIRQSDIFTMRGSGRGWRYVVDGFYALGVTADGDWQFIGYHTWRHGKDMRQLDLSVWRWYRNGGWPGINHYERYNVAESASANPVAAVEFFRTAIAKWEGGGQARMGRRSAR